MQSRHRLVITVLTHEKFVRVHLTAALLRFFFHRNVLSTYLLTYLLSVPFLLFMLFSLIFCWS